jgi:hypothetical protein
MPRKRVGADGAHLDSEISDEGQPERCRVLLRFRPLPSGEHGSTPFGVQSADTVVVRPRDAGSADDVSYCFDKIFPETTPQDDVFQHVMNDSVDTVLKGFNATVLAYGQSGAGKTYTMFGDGGENVGIIPRALEEIFKRIASDDGGGVFVVKASMLEIYMEEMKDLLRPTSHKLRLRESAFEGIWVEGLHHIYVPNAAVAVDLLRQGMGSRVIGSTGMNNQSSRSHCIFSLRVEQQHPDGFVQRGELHFADLAGAERVDRTGAHGQSLEEAKRINLSLSALGNCISALAQPGRAHIPFRDSKLTFLLKNSLGGNARTTLLINASSRWHDLEETQTALKFGARARSIKNVVKVNRKLSAEELERLLSKLKQEHDALQSHCLELEGQLAAHAACAGKGNDKDLSVLNGGDDSALADRTNTPSLQRRRRSRAGGGEDACDGGADGEAVGLTLSAVCNQWRRSAGQEDGEVPSPLRNLDPIKLLHRISELESANVDMQIEIESLVMQQQACSPTTVVRTSLAGHKTRALSFPASPLANGSSPSAAPGLAEPPSSGSTNMQLLPHLDVLGAQPRTLSTPLAGREGEESQGREGVRAGGGAGRDMSLQTSFNLADAHDWALALPRIGAIEVHEAAIQTSPCAAPCPAADDAEALCCSPATPVAKLDCACQASPVESQADTECGGGQKREGSLLGVGREVAKEGVELGQDVKGEAAAPHTRLKATMRKRRERSLFGGWHEVMCWLEVGPRTRSLFYARIPTKVRQAKLNPNP